MCFRNTCSVNPDVSGAAPDVSVSSSILFAMRRKGYSGKNFERPAFQKMPADIEAGKIRRVIVYRLDQISRSVLDFTNIIK